MADVDLRRTLERLDHLERELERVKREVLRGIAESPTRREVPPLFGSVKGGDVTEDDIAEAKRSLFRPTEAAEEF